MTSVIIVLSIVVLNWICRPSFFLAQAGICRCIRIHLRENRLETGIPFPIPVILGALGAVILGLLVGIPALRIRGLQLAAVTMALGVAIGTLYLTTDGSWAKLALFD